MKQSTMLKFAAVLAWAVLSLTTAEAAEPSSPSVEPALAARIGDEPVTRFEVANIANSMMPMGGFHGGTETGVQKEYWDKAVERAVDNALLQRYLEDRRPELVETAKEDAAVIVSRIRGRFEGEAEFQAALAEQGITEPLYEIAQVRLRLASLFENAVKSENVAEKKLKAYYRDNPGMFQTGPSVMTSLCLIEADGRTLTGEEMTARRELADKTLTELKAGANPADIDACATGLYPPEEQVYRFSKGYPAEDILGMETGAWQGPFDVLYGYLLVRPDRRLKSETIPFDEIKGQIRAIIAEAHYRETFQSIMKEMRDEVSVTILDDGAGLPAAR